MSRTPSRQYDFAGNPSYDGSRLQVELDQIYTALGLVDVFYGTSIDANGELRGSVVGGLQLTGDVFDAERASILAAAQAIADDQAVVAASVDVALLAAEAARDAALAAQAAAGSSETQAADSEVEAGNASIAAVQARDVAVSASLSADGYRSVAETAASGARLSEDMSYRWAEKLDGPVFVPSGGDPVDDGFYSSRYWAIFAESTIENGSFYYLGPSSVPPTEGNGGVPLVAGMWYFDTTQDRAFVWDGAAWVGIGSGGGSSVSTGPVFPSPAAEGDLHYLTVETVGLYVYYDDGTSSQWVLVALSGADLAPYRTSADQDVIDAAQDAAISAISADLSGNYRTAANQDVIDAAQDVSINAVAVDLATNYRSAADQDVIDAAQDTAVAADYLRKTLSSEQLVANDVHFQGNGGLGQIKVGTIDGNRGLISLKGDAGQNVSLTFDRVGSDTDRWNLFRDSGASQNLKLGRTTVSGGIYADVAEFGDAQVDIFVDLVVGGSSGAALLGVGDGISNSSAAFELRPGASQLGQVIWYESASSTQRWVLGKSSSGDQNLVLSGSLGATKWEFGDDATTVQTQLIYDRAGDDGRVKIGSDDPSVPLSTARVRIENEANTRSLSLDCYDTAGTARIYWGGVTARIMELYDDGVVQVPERLRAPTELILGANATDTLTTDGANIAILPGSNADFSRALFLQNSLGSQGYLQSEHSPGSFHDVNIVSQAQVFRHRGDGNAYAPTGWLIGSSRRVKKNFRRAAEARGGQNDAVGKLRKLAAVEYERDDAVREDGSEITQTGLIAEEVEAIVPHAVTTNPDGMKFYDPAQVLALAVEAIKDLSEEVVELRAELMQARANSRGGGRAN